MPQDFLRAEEETFGEIEATEVVVEVREGQLIAVVYVEHVEMLRVTLDEVGGRMGKESEDTALNVSGQAGDVLNYMS